MLDQRESCHQDWMLSPLVLHLWHQEDKASRAYTKCLCGRVRLAHNVITRCTPGVVSETRNDVVGVGDDEMLMRDTYVRRAI